MAESLDPWTEIERRLEAERKSLNAEIAAYPPPIAGCDAQFNHLLERRAALSEAIRRLATLRESQARSGDRGALESFVANCPFLLEPHDGERAP